jgi:hypothetical protein
MNDAIWIALIIAGAIIVVLYMFRGVLARFFFKAGHEGVEASLETRDQTTGSATASPTPPPRAGVNISGNQQIGRENKIEVGRQDVNVSDNTQLGEKQEIKVQPENAAKKKK